MPSSPPAPLAPTDSIAAFGGWPIQAVIWLEWGRWHGPAEPCALGDETNSTIRTDSLRDLQLPPTSSDIRDRKQSDVLGRVEARPPQFRNLPLRKDVKTWSGITIYLRIRGLGGAT